MTFTRTATAPISFLAYRTGNDLESFLHLQINSTFLSLSEADAQEFADYINEKFPRE